jgi:hypothetical protein
MDTALIGKIKSMRVVSSILQHGLHINALMSCCKKMWPGDGWRAWGGVVAGKLRPAMDFKKNFVCWRTHDGRFRW